MIAAPEAPVIRVAGRFDVERARNDFPILRTSVRGKPLVYLDNAATSQKPQVVIDTLTRFYQEDCSNIHRGVHLLSERSTETYESTRSKARKFINAADEREIVFVRGTTEAINLVRFTWSWQNIRPGDEILITEMEHHSNIVPWQMLCQEKGAMLRVAPINDRGELLLDEMEHLITPQTRLVAISHVSNALGTINPVREIIALAHRHGAVTLVDGAQAVPHLRVDVQDLDSDFYVFSGHKMFGPTGVGILHGKLEHLEAMPPFHGGGDMISSVSFAKTTYKKAPHKFEAGTPDIAGGIGLGATFDYLASLDWDAAQAHEEDLLEYGTQRLLEIPGLRIIGTAREKASVLSFVMDSAHPHDIGTILDQEGIAIRTGHHCAQPLMRRLGLPATARASLAFYNTRQDIDALVAGIHRVREIFA